MRYTQRLQYSIRTIVYRRVIKLVTGTAWGSAYFYINNSAGRSGLAHTADKICERVENYIMKEMLK